MDEVGSCAWSGCGFHAKCATELTGGSGRTMFVARDSCGPLGLQHSDLCCTPTCEWSPCGQKCDQWVKPDRQTFHGVEHPDGEKYCELSLNRPGVGPITLPNKRWFCCPN
ncbi:hypothetical protein Fcan01_27343 [Folsomia candida]|uniref:Uncharacterized protein n=1 Tax=Folsomia candida TaxID=158441 RepID=A0A226CX51_FOLCA|nr:hypothetical protein Fcan01_27343 [Folsomia candida]